MIVLYILIALIVIVLILSLIGPKDYQVQRSILIDRPSPEVFNYLKYLKNQDDWSPWATRDPNMKREFAGTDGQPGFVSRWEGNKEVGSGEQEITRIVENERMESELRFLKPFKSTSDAYIMVTPQDESQTKVTWGFSGQNKFPMTIMALFMNMEKMVGPDFEAGLAKLKTKLES